MSFSSRDTWVSLHSQYYVDPDTKHAGLMMDANIFLDSAHGIVQALGDAIGDSDGVNTDHLSSALNGVALLVEMGRQCVAQAHLRMALDGINRTEAL